MIMFLTPAPMRFTNIVSKCRRAQLAVLTMFFFYNAMFVVPVSPAPILANNAERIETDLKETLQY